MQWLFLGSLRSAIVVSATIPFALFFAVVILVALGESANLLSVGAVDFGLIVDATVVLVENVFRRLLIGATRDPIRSPHRDAGAANGLTGKLAIIVDAIGEVDRAVLFSRRSSSPGSCRCSPSPASRGTYSRRWRRPTRSRSRER